ncbi:hypothetical protein [Achromobacter insolitus]|uniref:hypothetical protein n=1 Tax=Achromobacter insolitus TaxID=217204 RepID=UPI0007C26418|nr:hypothetical protein [Achromobacter insolitus]OAD17161.1 hypothetical protein A3839_24485 [Achromobacter insolitus]
MTDETKTALLSKLRAPVADESPIRRALVAASNYIDTLGGSSKPYRAALASAPVAGEARMPPGYRVKVVEGHGYRITAPSGSDWVAHSGTPAGDLIAALYAAPQASEAVPIGLLATEHTGMRVDYSGLLKQARSALEHGETEPALAEMLRQFAGHLEELGQRWYAGDVAVVDELLQLYCVESEVRPALSAQPGAQRTGGSDAVPNEPLRVFSAGMWTYDGTGQAFSHTELDEAAFVTYRDALSAQKEKIDG